MNLHGINELRHPIWSDTSGIAERAVRRVKQKEQSPVLLQSGLDEKWWADSMECCCYLRNVQDLLTDGTTPNERRFGEPLQESFTKIFFWIRIDRGENLEDIQIADMEKLKNGCIRNLSSKNQYERSMDTTKRKRIRKPKSMVQQSVKERLRIPTTHSKKGTHRGEWRSQWRTSKRFGRVSSDRIEKWRWSPNGLLVHPRWFHLTSS